MKSNKVGQRVFCISCGSEMIDTNKEQQRGILDAEELALKKSLEGYVFECRNERCSQYRLIKIKGSDFN